jgi:hypothetical protein
MKTAAWRGAVFAKISPRLHFPPIPLSQAAKNHKSVDNEEPQSKLCGIESFSLQDLRMRGNKSPAYAVFRGKLRGIKPKRAVPLITEPILELFNNPVGY